MGRLPGIWESETSFSRIRKTEIRGFAKRSLREFAKVAKILWDDELEENRCKYTQIDQISVLETTDGRSYDCSLLHEAFVLTFMSVNGMYEI